MRVRTMLVWVIVLGFLAWAAYTIVVAGSSYLAAAGVVDQAVSDAMGRRKAQTATGMSQEAGRDFTGNIRAHIAAGARARGIDFPAEGLQVSEAPEGVRVSVHWPFPVVLYDDVVLFNLPLSLTRSYSLQ